MNHWMVLVGLLDSSIVLVSNWVAVLTLRYVVIVKPWEHYIVYRIRVPSQLKAVLDEVKDTLSHPEEENHRHVRLRVILFRRKQRQAISIKLFFFFSSSDGTYLYPTSWIWTSR